MNINPQFAVLKKNEDPKRVLVHYPYAQSPQATLATELIKSMPHFVPVRQSGNDVEYMPLSAEQMVSKAVEMANLAWAQFDSRGWLVVTADINELREDVGQVGF